MTTPSPANEVSAALVINAPVLPPSVRHQVIFDVLEALPPTHVALLINDHDPKPLFYQLKAEQPEAFSFDYVESGPARFAIRITRRGPSA